MESAKAQAEHILQTMMRSMTVLMRAQQGTSQEARFEFTHQVKNSTSVISLKSFYGTLLWAICQIPLAFGVIAPRDVLGRKYTCASKIKTTKESVLFPQSRYCKLQWLFLLSSIRKMVLP